MRAPLTSLHRPAARLAAVLLAALAGGCVYHLGVQQGNFLEKRSIDQLKLGMTRSQVRYLMGTPMVPTVFDSDRWDYLYYLKFGTWKQPHTEMLTIYFENDKVVRLDSHGFKLFNSESAPAEAPARPQT